MSSGMNLKGGTLGVGAPGKKKIKQNSSKKKKKNGIDPW